MRLVYTKVFGSAFSVAVIPTLQDNFSYLIHDQTTGAMAAVDVNSDWKPLKQHLEQLKLWGSVEHPMTAILTTHKHHDHSGGNTGLASAVGSVWRPHPVYGTLRVIGGANDGIPGVTHPVKGGDTVSVGALEVRVLDVPCHTKGHVAYYVSHPQHKADGAALFTGDTLFIAGLGAFFEGSDKDMCTAMERLANVNGNDADADAKTFVFPGHEYTAGFMKFSIATYPDKQSSDYKFIVEQEAKSGRTCLCGGVTDTAFQKAMNKGDAVKLMNYLYNACD
eukprot:gene12118-8341_t